MFPWLFTGIGHHPQKPDLFVCPVSFYRKRVPNNSRAKFYPERFRYGVIEDQRLYEGVVLLDCKLSCTREAFGELCIHLQHLGLKQNVPTRGMLFSKKEFWLYEQLKGAPLSLTSGEWKANGSVDAIRSFFNKSLGPFRSINMLCEALGVCALDPKSFESCESGFLGQGGFGRVIRVLSVDGTSSALKLVRNTDVNLVLLKKEYRRLQQHTTNCDCGLIATSTSEFVVTPELCGFVLQPVGNATCTRQMIFEDKKPSLKEVLLALYSLHSHLPRPIIHGDPRLPNLIVTGDGLTWIDLMTCEEESDISAIEFSIDMNILIASLFPSQNTRGNRHICALVNSYSANLNRDSIAALEDYLKQLD